MRSQKGQGLPEYAITIVIVAMMVIVILALLSGCCWLIFLPLIVPAWPWIVTQGTALVADLQAGDPTAIFITAVIAIVILFLIFRRRRQ